MSILRLEIDNSYMRFFEESQSKKCLTKRFFEFFTMSRYLSEIIQLFPTYLFFAYLTIYLTKSSGYFLSKRCILASE